MCNARVRISAFASAPRCHTSAFDHSPTARPTALTLPPTAEAPARAFVPAPPPAGGLLSPRVLAGAEPAWRPAGASSVPRPGEQRSSRKTLVPGTNPRTFLTETAVGSTSLPFRATPPPCHGPSLAETAVEEPPFFFAPRDVRRCARFPLTPVRAAAFRSLPGLRTARASLGTSASGRNLRICCEEEAAEPEAACGTEAPGTSGPSPCGSHRGARAPES